MINLETALENQQREISEFQSRGGTGLLVLHQYIPQEIIRQSYEHAAYKTTQQYLDGLVAKIIGEAVKGGRPREIRVMGKDYYHPGMVECTAHILSVLTDPGDALVGQFTAGFAVHGNYANTNNATVHIYKAPSRYNPPEMHVNYETYEFKAHYIAWPGSLSPIKVWQRTF